MLQPGYEAGGHSLSAFGKRQVSPYLYLLSIKGVGDG